jgi:hypothetical protein
LLTILYSTSNINIKILKISYIEPPSIVDFPTPSVKCAEPVFIEIPLEFTVIPSDALADIESAETVIPFP